MTLRRRASAWSLGRSSFAAEELESRRLMATVPLFFPPAAQYPSEDLRQPPVIHSRDGTLDATLNMVRAGFASDPILYGGRPLFSSPPASNPQGDPPAAVYAMAYQVDAYGQSLPAQFPGPILQLDRGETLNLHVNDRLADAGNPNVVFDTNLHTHGLHVSPLNDGDNVYREIVPGQGMDVSITIPADHQADGVNWYHVHRHETTHPQVYGGLAGLLLVGDPLDPWPQYKDQNEEVYMAFSEVNIQGGALTSYNAGASGAGFTAGWQKRINGQVNPTIHIRPGETQVWHMASIGPFGGFNPAITDANLARPWDATLLVQDGNGQNLRPYSLTLGADPERMQDLAAATLVMPGNRLTMAVTAPKAPGTYYLIDGWGGQDKPALDKAGRQTFYVLATIQVDGPPVTGPAPVFNDVGPVDPLFLATPDVRRTFEFTIEPGVTPNENVFLINGKTFGEGVMPQLQIGTVEEWTLTNPKLPGPNANHPFHIHQGNFVVTAVDGVPVDPDADPPPGRSSLAYISPRDVIDIPSGGSITIRFKVDDFPGKYVFHCHILKHEDQGMMSPVLQFGPAGGLRMPFGSATSARPDVIVLDGGGDELGTVRPFGGRYRGAVATASALGESRAIQTMAVGTASLGSVVRIYDDGSLKATKTFHAFPARLGRGVSVAVGGLSADGRVVIAVGSRAAGHAVVRLFDVGGKLLREFKGLLPGRLSHGVNVAVGDVNGDNFDDLVVSAGKGAAPMVTALDGQQIATGARDPATLFTFMAGGGMRAGARVAVGYVAPSTTPSYQANLITTPESGPMAGTVEVWNAAEVSGATPHPMPMASDMPRASARAAQSPMLSFVPFSRTGRAVQIGSNYLGLPGVPVVTSWVTPHKVAFTSIDVNDVVSTQIRDLGVVRGRR